MPTIREINRKKKPLTPTQLKKEYNRLVKAMAVIRFLAFKHEVGYWNDAKGTDAEKLHSILTLARIANWSHDGENESNEIKKHHTSK